MLVPNQTGRQRATAWHCQFAKKKSKDEVTNPLAVTIAIGTKAGAIGRPTPVLARSHVYKKTCHSAEK